MGKHTRRPTMGGVEIRTDCRVPFNAWFPPDFPLSGPHTCGPTPCDGAISDGTVVSRVTPTGTVLYSVSV